MQYNMLKHPPSDLLMTSKAVVLFWFPDTCFGVSFSDVSSYVCTDYFQFISVWVAEWPPFGNNCYMQLR